MLFWGSWMLFIQSALSTSSSVDAPQTLMVVSKLPEINVLPSAENVTQLTLLVWPVKLATCSIVARFQSRMALSEQVASVFPS